MSPAPQNAKPTPGKYAEYQSYCRSALYDIDHEYTRFLRDDETLKDIKIEIDERRFVNAEKLTLSHRSRLGELNFTETMILISALKRNFTEAFKYIDAGLEQFKTENSVKRLAALTYEMQSNYIESRMLIQDLLQKTKNVQYHEDICRLFSLDSQHYDTDMACAKAEKLLPNNFLAPIWQGISLRERQEFEEAHKAFEKSLSIRKSEFALVCLAELEILKKNSTAAGNYFQQAIDYSPKSLRAHMGLAQMYFENRQFEKSLEQFKTMCSLGLKDKLPFRKAANELVKQKNILAEKFFHEIQKCP